MQLLAKPEVGIKLDYISDYFTPFNHNHTKKGLELTAKNVIHVRGGGSYRHRMGDNNRMSNKEDPEAVVPMITG